MAPSTTLDAPTIDAKANPKVGETWRFTPGDLFTSARMSRINAPVTIVAIELASESGRFGAQVGGYDIRFEDGVIFKASPSELSEYVATPVPPSIDSNDDGSDEGEDDTVCRTPDCDEPNDNGEGWDGYCGNCADKRDPDSDDDESTEV